jgi:hypothetical protein
MDGPHVRGLHISGRSDVHLPWALHVYAEKPESSVPSEHAARQGFPPKRALDGPQ